MRSFFMVIKTIGWIIFILVALFGLGFEAAYKLFGVLNVWFFPLSILTGAGIVICIVMFGAFIIWIDDSIKK